MTYPLWKERWACPTWISGRTSTEAVMRIIKLLPVTCAILAIWAAAPALAGDREFHEIVNRLAATYHKKPLPFMGFVSFVSRFAQPQGVSAMKLAVFDDIDPSLSPDENEFDALMQ